MSMLDCVLYERAALLNINEKASMHLLQATQRGMRKKKQSDTQTKLEMIYVIWLKAQAKWPPPHHYWTHNHIHISVSCLFTFKIVGISMHCSTISLAQKSIRMKSQILDPVEFHENTCLKKHTPYRMCVCMRVLCETTADLCERKTNKQALWAQHQELPSLHINTMSTYANKWHI